jgi:transposase
MTLVKEMPVRALARIVNEHDTRLWRVLDHYVQVAYRQLDLSSLVAFGIDEKAIRRGHDYVTLFVDLNKSQVVYVTEGRSAGTVAEFRGELFRRGIDGGAIRDITCDMSPAYIKGIELDFPWAQVTFDKFHVMKLINEAVDQVRRDEQRERPELKKTRFAWLTHREHQTNAQAKLIEGLSLKRLNLKTARAYQLSLTFQEFWQQPTETAEGFLKHWYWWATHSRLEPMRTVARTIKRHWRGILNWFRSRISNAVLEGINSLVQAVKARARGYRTTKNFINMIYLVAGKLNFALPT